MTCPHTDTTAILAAFGEAPADFDVHLSHCAECQAVVDTHTETLAVLSPALQAPPTPHAQRSWRAGVTVVLLAAVALLAIQTLSPQADPAREAVDSPVHDLQHAAALELSFETSLDSELSDLELELALMSLE